MGPAGSQKHPRARSAVAIGSVLLAVCLGGSAATPARAQSDRFDERITVSEVEVPVRVLVDGRPLRGLREADFEVLGEDGERLEIVGFRVVDLEDVPSRQADSSAPVEGGPDPVRSDAPPEARAFLYLFDLDFSRRHLLARALEGIRTSIADDLHPADRVAVAYLLDAELRLLYGFTTDRAVAELCLGVVDALLDLDSERLERRLATLREAGRRAATPGDLVERFGASGAAIVATGEADDLVVAPPPTAGSTDDDRRSGPTLTDADAVGLVRAQTILLGRLASLLGDVAGQKHLVYLSEGFPSVLIESSASLQRPLVLGHMQRLFRELRRAGWTVHGVDVEGIPAAGRAGFDAHALFYLSNETGGDLFENYNRIDRAGRRLAERTSVIYVLTVRPGPIEGDGELRRLRVRLRNGPAGAELAHRAGYYVPPEPTGVSEGREGSPRPTLEIADDRLRTGEPLVVRLSGPARGARIEILRPAGVRGWEPVPAPIELLPATSSTGAAVALVRTDGLELGGYRVEARTAGELLDSVAFTVVPR